MTLRAALVGGPMYDDLYSLLPDDVEVIVHADHPTLNRTVAELLAQGERIDVLSTHGKYAPSQAQWLTPLDDLVDTAELAPGAVDLCRFDGTLLSAPRNIDVRILWYRHDLMDAPPPTWGGLVSSPHAFGFPGRESGLFGTFFELVVSQGGALFDAGARPTMVSTESVAAVQTLRQLAAKAPNDLPEWHYDDVDNALLSGRVECAAAWPGATGPIRRSALAERLAPAPYFSGPTGLVSYAGCHSWAIPTTCADTGAAAELIAYLCSRKVADADAQSGSVPAHVEAFAAVTPVDDIDARRLTITRDTIRDNMITYPALSRFPEVEDAGWGAINAALRGTITPEDAVHDIQRAAEEALR